MLRIVAVRRRGWHCAFTKACAFEQLGPGFRLAGTNMTFCASHLRLADLMSHSGGHDGAEALAQVNLVPKKTGAA